MRRRLAVLACAGAALLGTLATAHESLAQCGGADLIDTIPPDGASGVPTNTPLLATYELGAVHTGEEVIVTRQGSAPQPLAATYRSAVRTLSASLPSGALEPNSEYTVEWPGLSTGGSRPRQGNGATVRFSVGAGPDMSRPEFEGASGIDWDFERKYDDCSRTESERYIFNLYLPKASYQGGSDLLTLIAFQTRGPTLRSDENGRPIPEPVYTQRYTDSGFVTIKRAIADGVGEVCFSAIMQAPGGMISQGANKEVCTTTVRPPFFDGCSLGTPLPTEERSSFWLCAGVALGLFGRRRRPHSRTPSV